MDSSRRFFSTFAELLHAGQWVLQDLGQTELKVVAHMEETVEQFFSTEPADRTFAERAILHFHHQHNVHGKANDWLDQNPQFIWCHSPQAMMVVAKVLSDIYEGTRPVKPTGMKPGPGAKIHAPAREVIQPGESEYVVHGEIAGRWSSTAHSRDKLDNLFRARPETLQLRSRAQTFHNIWSWSLQNIATQIRSAIKSNPDTTLFSEEGGNGKDSELVERCLAATEPHISSIKMKPKLFGRRLALKHAWLGQHATDDKSYSEIGSFLRKSCGWVLDYGSFVFCCERPEEIHYQDSGVGPARFRLHNDVGPAVKYRDGWQLHSISGVNVPSFIVEKTHLITTFKINRETNQEIRRIMIDRYKLGQNPSGIAAFMLDSGAKRISHDERWGTLWRFTDKAAGLGTRWEIERAEPIVMLEVINRSPEPDGSFKHYYLRVPPTIKNSHQAAAWTFGFSEEEFDQYNPLQET
jgi:hypothetical protein